MIQDARSYCTLILIVLLSSFILWLPFIIRSSHWAGLSIPNSDFQYIYGSFDGPLYIIPAKTMYDPDKIDVPGKGLIISLPLSAGYFPAHLPLYPAVIRIFGELIGYARSLIFVNLLATMLLVSLFYYSVKSLALTRKPLLLSAIFLFLPRFLVLRSVGAPESLLMLLMLGSMFFFEKKNYLVAGILGGLSAMTKTPGVLLFIAFLLVFLEQYLLSRKIFAGFLHKLTKVVEIPRLQKSSLGMTLFNILQLSLIPAGLILVFLFYQYRYNDFFAYFHTNANVPMPYPFAAFNFQQKWVGSAWLEDIVLYLFIYLISVVYLWNSKYRSLFYFSLVFFSASIFIQHRDISRYMIPLWPIACIALEKFLTSKKFLIVFLILLPAIYMYAWNFIVFNVMPIGDWSPFL